MFKISLKTARELNGYSIKEMASRCNLTENYYKECEDDFGIAPARVAFMIRSLLRLVWTELVFEYKNKNRVYTDSVLIK